MGNKVNFRVELDGSPVVGLKRCTINQTVFDHHYFEIKCRVHEKDNIIKSIAESNIGKEVKIELYPESGQSKEKNYFKGIITGIRLSKDEVDEITFSGYSRSKLLDDGIHSQSFTEKNLGDIVREVARRHNVEVKADPSYSKSIPYVVQYNESTFQFLSRLADTYGEWFFYNGTGLTFGKLEKEKANNLQFETDLVSFSMLMSARPSNFKLLSYDHISHQFPEAAAGSAQVGGLDDFGKLLARHSEDLFSFEPTHLYGQSAEEKALLNHFSKKQKAAIAANYMIFDGSSLNHMLNTGSSFKVLGKFFDRSKSDFKEANYGEFRIVKLVHSITGSGEYINHFTAIPASLELPPQNQNVKQPVGELQPAEVVSNDDPEKLGRVEVSFWWQKQRGEKTPWIRVAANSAGGVHGTYFVPEKGDQVLVGFEHNNPDKPYVLGSLYHGKSKPDKNVPDSSNNKKSIKTKSGNHISFNDESGQEEIKIENGKNSITLTLSGNGKITIMSDGGDLELKAKNIKIVADEKIEASAGSDLSVKASQKTSISAGTDLEVTGVQKATISGNELTAEGKMKCNVGSPSAQTKMNGMNITVEATAINDIKGSIIKLN